MINETLEANRAYQRDKDDAYNRGYKQGKADAEATRIRGRWIRSGSWSEGVGMGESYGHYWKCNKCGHLEKGDWDECGCNYCSNCGSDNREVTE